MRDPDLGWDKWAFFNQKCPIRLKFMQVNTCAFCSEVHVEHTYGLFSLEQMEEGGVAVTVVHSW